VEKSDKVSTSDILHEFELLQLISTYMTINSCKFLLT